MFHLVQVTGNHQRHVFRHVERAFSINRTVIFEAITRLQDIRRDSSDPINSVNRRFSAASDSDSDYEFQMSREYIREGMK